MPRAVCTVCAQALADDFIHRHKKLRATLKGSLSEAEIMNFRIHWYHFCSVVHLAC